MSDPALPCLFNSQPTTSLKLRTDLWACLLSILILALLPGCMGMMSAGLLSEKDLGFAPSAGPSPGLQTERLTFSPGMRWFIPFVQQGSAATLPSGASEVRGRGGRGRAR